MGHNAAPRFPIQRNSTNQVKRLQNTDTLLKPQILNLLPHTSSFGCYYTASNFRAIGIEQLIGSVGGYIGLCMGYSIVQIPEIIISVVIYLKKYVLLTRQNKPSMKNKIFLPGKQPFYENEPYCC